MSLKPIREYFEKRILEVDKSFVDYKEAFETNFPGNKDKQFHVFYHNLTPNVKGATSTEDTIAVRVKLFFKSTKDNRLRLDEAFDIANEIRLHSMNPKFVKTMTNVKGVISDGINPDPEATNDNSFVFTINFNVRAVFSTVETNSNTSP